MRLFEKTPEAMTGSRIAAVDYAKTLAIVCVVMIHVSSEVLLGRQIGLSPLITLLALYTGFRLCGVAGMILFPIGAIFLRQVLAPPPQPEG